MTKTSVLLLVFFLVSGLQAIDDVPDSFDVQQLEEVEEQTSNPNGNIEIVEGAAYEEEDEESNNDLVVNGDELEAPELSEFGDMWEGSGDHDGGHHHGDSGEDFEGSGSPDDGDHHDKDHGHGDKDHDHGDKDHGDNKPGSGGKPPFKNENRAVNVDLDIKVPILGKLLNNKQASVPLNDN